MSKNLYLKKFAANATAPIAGQGISTPKTGNDPKETNISNTTTNNKLNNLSNSSWLSTNLTKY